MNIEWQVQLAKRDGEQAESDYLYHTGMVDNPLPYYRFKTLKALLDLHLAADPDGKDRYRDTKINSLCRMLGY